MSEKHTYLVDRYSQSLTKFDVIELFERLREAKGTITAATKEVDVTRKTVNDWDKSTDDVKTVTKRKILKASLKADPLGTMDYLVRKNAADYHEILERYINVAFKRILSLDDPVEFQESISSFEKYIKSYRGALFDIKTTPIEEMMDAINQKAGSLGVEGIIQDIDLIPPRRLSLKFINLLEVFNRKTMFKEEMAEKIGLPNEFIDRACNSISYIDPSPVPIKDPTEFAMVEEYPCFSQEVRPEKVSRGYIHARNVRP